MLLRASGGGDDAPEGEEEVLSELILAPKQFPMDRIDHSGRRRTKPAEQENGDAGRDPNRRAEQSRAAESKLQETPE
jgi:hypothetical protein